MSQTLFAVHEVLLVILLITLILCDDSTDSKYKDLNSERYCTVGPDGEYTCNENNDNKLFAHEPISVGHVQEIAVADKTLKLKTLSLKPAVFEIEDFLNFEEASHLIQMAIKQGLEESQTRSDSGNINNHKMRLMDVDRDMMLSINEMILTLEDSFDLYFTEEDIRAMYNELEMDKNGDSLLTPMELNSIDQSEVLGYIFSLVKQYPMKRSRQSKQVWLFPDKSKDDIFMKIQARVMQLTRLSPKLIQKSDVQIVQYDKDGHYNAHYDSATVNSDYPCCHRGEVEEPCRLCRFMTVMFYLNDVEEGGETAFPLADNATFHVEEFRLKHLINLQQHCHKANLVVKPKVGKALVWYNHKVNKESGWLGRHDDYSWHGGCPVVNGQKWIANFWIKAIDSLKP